MSKVHLKSQGAQFNNEQSSSSTVLRSSKATRATSDRGIPTQSPPSRIGRPISEFIPSESLQLPSQPRQSTQDARQSVTEYDRDGDGIVDLAVGRTLPLEVSSNEPDNLTVHWMENGVDTLLWSKDGGSVYWEQRTLPDGSFENSFDKNGDGAVDLLIRGRGGHVERFTESPEATREASRADVTPALNVDPSMLAMPHAVLNSDAIVVRYNPGLESADVEARIPFSSFVPPRDPASILSLEVAPNWAGSQSTCTFDGDAITLAVKGSTAAAWMGGTPLLKVRYQTGGEATLALYAPKVLTDERQHEKVALEDSIATARKISEAQTRDIAVLEFKIRFPETQLAETKPLVALDKERQQLIADLDQLRPALLERFVQNSAGRAAGLTDAASAAGLEPREISAFKAAIELDKSGASAQAVVDSLAGASVLDFALAFSERHVSPGARAFQEKVNRQFMLLQELSIAQADFETARARFVKEKSAILTGLIASRSETRKQLDGWVQRLIAVPDAQPAVRRTEHKLFLKTGS